MVAGDVRRQWFLQCQTATDFWFVFPGVGADYLVGDGVFMVCFVVQAALMRF